MDPLMPELERIRGHQEKQLRNGGINGFDELARIREILTPKLGDWKITWPGREKAPKVVPPTGPKYAIALGLTVSVEPKNKLHRTWIVMKNKMQPFMGQAAQNRRVLEVELNGVYLYIEGSRVILTDQKLTL